VIDAQIRSEIDIEDESFQSLKASIWDWNVMAPIILMRMEKGYRLIAGERRLRACRELGLPTIPARWNPPFPRLHFCDHVFIIFSHCHVY